MTIIQITQVTHPDGGETSSCTIAGTPMEATTKGASCSLRELARKIFKAGIPDAPWGTVGMSGRSIHALAARTLRERDAGFENGWWTPHPKAAPEPLLCELVASRKASVAEFKQQRKDTR